MGFKEYLQKNLLTEGISSFSQLHMYKKFDNDVAVGESTPISVRLLTGKHVVKQTVSGKGKNKTVRAFVSGKYNNIPYFAWIDADRTAEFINI